MGEKEWGRVGRGGVWVKKSGVEWGGVEWGVVWGRVDSFAPSRC